MKRPVFSPEQIKSNDDFDDMAMATFQYQYEQNSVYRSYCDLLNVSSSDIHKLEDVPYLPIQFFKRLIKCDQYKKTLAFALVQVQRVV